MAGSTFGKNFRITTWGESHGSAIGVIVDGCPAGLSLCEEDIQVFLDRRKPGQSEYTTGRREGDRVEILSGIFEGQTTGTPISLLVRNTDQRSHDYGNLSDCYRPGHADYPFDLKYGLRDYRGGGRSSGRETIGRVAAGAIAIRILNTMGIEFLTYTESIGDITVDSANFSLEEMKRNPLSMPDAKAAAASLAYLDELRAKEDSAGGTIRCKVYGLPVGLGEPVFDKIDANLAKAMFSIGSVKGFEIGDGFAAARATGKTNNDAFYFSEGSIQKKTNHSGGTLGGMTDGAPLSMRIAIKPTPSIGAPQQTVSRTGEELSLSIHGRHDPIIVPRALVVVESMAALTILDALFENMHSRMDRICDFYNRDNNQE